MNVDRCVCYSTPFQRLQDYVEQHGGPEHVNFEQLQAVFECGRGCGLCVPYIDRMLRTGRTSFSVEPPSPCRSIP